MLTDIVLFTLSYVLSFLLRYDFTLPSLEYLNYINILIPILLLKVSIFYFFDLYKGMWRYTSLEDLLNIIKASFVSCLFIFSIIALTTRFQGFARSVFLMDTILTIFLIGGFRMGIRLAFSYDKKEAFPWRRNRAKVANGSATGHATHAGHAGNPCNPCNPAPSASFGH